MSTREPSLPAELQLMQPTTPTGLAEQPGLASARAPSPGLALAAARVPGGPTLPDWDPSALTRAVFQAANEFFGVPASSTEAASPTNPNTVMPQGAAPSALTTTTAPTATAPPTSIPSNPFSAPPTFDALLGGVDESALENLRFPLLQEPTTHTGAPYFMPAPERPTLASPPRVDDVTAHEIDSPQAASQGSTTTALPPTRGAFDAHAIRGEFPILQEQVHGKRLVWLDNAATTQKPRAVIDRISSFYEHENSNIHRAAHALAARATEAYESARETTRRFLNAPSVKEIIFVRGATEGINLIAQSWGRRNVSAGDEIVVSWLEHHANIVPWQMLCSEKGARLRVAPVDDRGQIILEEYEKLLGPKTRLVSISQVSNALGTVTPAKAMIDMAHRHGARVLLDGAQSVSHLRVDVQQLDCDFFVFSGHKVFAPTGIGAVFGKSAVLDAMPPWQGGGNMIQDVTFERTVYQPAPARFEAGTGNIADAAGLGAALDWLTRVGLENVERHEHELLVYATQQLQQVDGLKIIGTAAEKAGVVSFTLAGHSTADVAAYLDREGIAVRGGHHCAQPILRRFGLESTVRASFAPYNLPEDVDALATALHKLQGGGAWSR